jgi:hypothetical protein
MHRIRRLDLILIQAVIAAALSFAHLHDIADAAGQGGWKGWAYPVSVDLLMVMAWRRVRSADVVSKKAPWFWFLLSLGASLSANVGTAGVVDLEHTPTWLRIAVAGWPVLAFLGGSLLIHSAKPAEDVDDADELREAPSQSPQEPVSEPPVESADREPLRAVPDPYEPVLKSYRETAEALGVNEATVRGWANNGTVMKYDGLTPNTRRVDLLECQRVQNSRVAAGS